jgi:hypothetical protein
MQAQHIYVAQIDNEGHGDGFPRDYEAGGQRCLAVAFAFQQLTGEALSIYLYPKLLCARYSNWDQYMSILCLAANYVQNLSDGTASSATARLGIFFTTHFCHPRYSPATNWGTRAMAVRIIYPACRNVAGCNLPFAIKIRRFATCHVCSHSARIPYHKKGFHAGSICQINTGPYSPKISLPL